MSRFERGEEQGARAADRARRLVLVALAASLSLALPAAAHAVEPAVQAGLGPVTADQLTAAVERAMPTRTFDPATLQRTGGDDTYFEALAPGVLAMQWWLVPSRGGLEAGRQAQLVAAGVRIFSARGGGIIHVGLTPAGRMLIQHRRRLRLVQAAAFATEAGTRVKALRRLMIVEDLCATRVAGITCRLGRGRRTPGGVANGKASHVGWPAINGIYLVHDHRGRRGRGTAFNDELLGGHGSDRLVGDGGRDVLWGDQWPTGNNTWQHDTLSGGPGRDFLYASHGANTVSGGLGDDVIHAHYGRGRIDCGPGYDLVYLSHRSRARWRLHRCERITYHSGLTALTARG